MTMTEIADKVNKVSNRTAYIVLTGVILCTASAMATYYGVTGAIKDLRTDLKYYKHDQRITDSLQDVHVEELRLVKVQEKK